MVTRWLEGEEVIHEHSTVSSAGEATTKRLELRRDTNVDKDLLERTLSCDLSKLGAKIVFSSLQRLENDPNDEAAKEVANSHTLEQLIDGLALKRAAREDVVDFKIMFSLVKEYERVNKEPYKMSPMVAKRVIDKAHSYHVQSSKNGTRGANVSVLELIVVEMGKIVASHITNDLSYYRSTEEESKLWLTMENLQRRQLLFKYLHFCYALIQEFSHKNDSVSIFRVWSVIHPFHTKIFNSSIRSQINNGVNMYYFYDTLAKVIQSLSKERRYRDLIEKLITTLPVDSIKLCPTLMTALLSHCTRTDNKKLSLVLMSQYTDKEDIDTSKHTTGQLNALFSAAVKLGQFPRAQGIVNHLQNEGVRFNKFHFDQLIRYVLKGHLDMCNEERANLAWEMCMKFKDLNPDALLTYLNFMIDTRAMDNKKVAAIYKTGARLKVGQRTWFDRFNVLYMKYLVRNNPLHIAVEVYKNSTAPEKSRILAELDLPKSRGINPFAKNYHSVKLEMSVSSKNIILRDIYQTAYSHLQKAIASESENIHLVQLECREVCHWALTEMCCLRGTIPSLNPFVVSAVGTDLLRTIRQQARRVGFELDEKATISEEQMKYLSDRGERINVGKPLKAHFLRATKGMFK